MWEMQNLFTGDAFSAVTLTSKVNNVPYSPQLLGSMGLYAVDGVRTTDVAIAERNGSLAVVQTSPRHTAPGQISHGKEKLRKATVSRIALEAGVNADEVQDALGQIQLTGQSQLQTLEGLLDERLNGPFGLRARIELTHEFHRLGGIKGVVLDKDGSTLYDWFDFFDIAALADHNTNFGALTADGAVFEQECAVLKRAALRELEGLPVSTARVIVFCGDNYYDQVYGNKETKAARKNRDAGRDSDVFGKNQAFSAINYGGIDWVNYRGTADGTVGIGTDEARLFVAGVPGLFQMLFGPPDVLGMTNMKGLPVHSFMRKERQTSSEAVVEGQSNPLTFCARPRSLRRLTKS